MKSLKFLTEHLTAAPFTWRESAVNSLYRVAIQNDEGINQLKLNLKSNNFDIVENSLKVLLKIVSNNPNKLLNLKNDLLDTAKRCCHFKIAFYVKVILETLSSIDPSFQEAVIKATNIITPKNIAPEDGSDDWYRYGCQHTAEYFFGDADYKYQLSNVCNAFKCECDTALKKVKRIMITLGYEKNKQYWKDVPYKWKEGRAPRGGYKTKLHYYSYHSIQKFLMYCIDILPIKQSDWGHFLSDQSKYEPTIIENLIADRPSFIKLKNIKLETNTWLKQKVNRKDIYSPVDINNKWVILFESSRIRYEDKLLRRYTYSCFSKSSLSGLKNKDEISVVQYNCPKCNIDEVPVIASEKNKLFISDYNHRPELEGLLLPCYGEITEVEYDDVFTAIFPSPDLVNDLKLIQKKGTLTYYKGKELVIKTINWKNGYTSNVGNYGEDKFSLADYGTVLMIKGKYLKSFLKTRKLRLLSVGEIDKSKVDKHGSGYEYKPENIRRKRFIFQISKPII